MSFEGTSNARWRGRAIAVAGIATAATIAGFALAASAQAATPSAPSLTLTAPAQLDNVGDSGTLSLRVNNTQSGNAAITAAAPTSLTITLGGIIGLPCADITLTPENTGPTSVGVTGSPALTSPGGNTPCAFTVTGGFAQNANSDVTYNYALAVHAPAVLGTLSGVATFDESNGSPVVHVTASSNTTSTSVVNPAVVNPNAPAFTGSPVPPAIVFHNYSFVEATNVGTPTAAADFTAFGFHKNSTTGLYDNTTTRHATDSIDGHPSIDLSSINCCGEFEFDTVTGRIVSSETPDETDSVRYWTWIIVANNGVGGATTAVPGIGSGSATQPTPGVAVHDVQSSPFVLPILFSDVPLSHAFSAEIYQLADDGQISGFADGTFRPTLNISRQAFAAILDDERGSCSIFNPSPFPDVPNNSQFCRPIRDLAGDGIVNGFSDGKFHPTASITRQAMSAMFYRANAVWNLDAPASDALCTQPIPFNDVHTTNPFCGDIEWMAGNGLTTGFSDGGFHPTAFTSRQATAAFIVRFDNL